MVNTREEQTGRFAVQVELANFRDESRAEAGDIPASAVRRLNIRGVVDTGATRLVLPASAVKQLGLLLRGEASVRYADGRTDTRPIATGVSLTWGGRSSVFNAVVEPDRDSALIGALVLEDLDLVVDCTNKMLVPRDPKQIVSELE